MFPHSGAHSHSLRTSVTSQSQTGGGTMAQTEALLLLGRAGAHLMVTLADAIIAAEMHCVMTASFS